MSEKQGDKKAGKAVESPPTRDNETAADNSGDDYVDPDFATLQKTLSQKRRAAKNSSAGRLQAAFPFPFLPNIRPLTVSDLSSCIALENAAFPDAEHRCSPEKFKYRLTQCPELSIGLFCTVVPEQAKGWKMETLAAAKRVETDRKDGAVSVLLAHMVATKCLGDHITDADMSIPADWRTRGGKSAEVGHQESGRTIAAHSLAVSPRLQGCGVGVMVMKAFIQQMRGSGLGDRIALICQDFLVPYYERFGYKLKGESTAQFGGGGWYDMVLELSPSTLAKSSL